MSTRIIWLVGVVAVCGACGSVKHDAPADAKADAPGDVASVPMDGACPQALDQAVAPCASPPIAQCTNAFVTYSGGTATGQIYAQVFTPKTTGSINHLRLRGSNPVPSSNPIEVMIIDLQNNPVAYIDPQFVVANHVLASTTTPMTAVDDWHDVSFTTPAHVVAGLPYAINVRQVGDTNPGQSNYMRWAIYNDYTAMVDTYPRGQLFECQRGTCTAQSTYQDAVFEVYVSPNTCN